MPFNTPSFTFIFLVVPPPTPTPAHADTHRYTHTLSHTHTRTTAQALSVDHKPNSKDERQRIENAGGVVVWAGTWRVCGVLAVSRAFGDRPLKRYVIATPDIKEENLKDDDEFLILASDGLWDVMSNQVRLKCILCDAVRSQDIVGRLHLHAACVSVSVCTCVCMRVCA